jgi:predicted  nucleic acid-binding Zn-ribbon protein
MFNSNTEFLKKLQEIINLSDSAIQNINTDRNINELKKDLIIIKINAKTLEQVMHKIAESFNKIEQVERDIKKEIDHMHED